MPKRERRLVRCQIVFYSFYSGVVNKAILLDSFVSYMSSHIDVIVIHNFGNLPMICYNSPVLKKS